MEFDIKENTAINLVHEFLKDGHLDSHCVKIVQIRSFFWSVFIPNTGKFGPEKTPHLDNFHAVSEMQILIRQHHNYCRFLYSTVSNIYYFNSRKTHIQTIQTVFLRDYNVWERSKQNAAMYFNNYEQYRPIPCEVVEAKKTDPAPLSEAERKSILKFQKMK